MSTGSIGSDFNAVNAADTETATKRSYPKTHANYWKARLEHRTYTHDGKTFEVAEWSVRIHFKGIRKSFDLETANKEEAAVKVPRREYRSTPARTHGAEYRNINRLGCCFHAQLSQKLPSFCDNNKPVLTLVAEARG